MMQKNIAPFARGQQLIGVPEHPFEATFRNGCLICPYEEMEVQQYPENSGLYMIPLLGEPFELFGRDGFRAKQAWENGHLPVAVHTVHQQGLQWEESTYGVMLEGDEVKTGTEPLILQVRWRIKNPGKEPRQAVLSLALCDCFRPPIETDGTWDKFYWKSFLNRDVVYEILSEEREPAAYPYPLYPQDDCLMVRDKGVLLYSSTPFTYEAQAEGGEWKNGTHVTHRVKFVLTVEPGAVQELTYAVPYLPLEAEKLPQLRELTWERGYARITDLWQRWLEKSSVLHVPGTKLSDAWLAQTATTLMLLDYQNKGAPELHGRNLITTWADGYPDRMLGYAHLTNALYEFVWAQESGYWVLGMLDQQGYHDLVEKYMEMFFVMQGHAMPGVHDPSILPPPEVGQAYTGTTIHAWLNSNGGVLGAIANHYRLTRNKAWIWEHKDSILSSCRWLEWVRRSTKTEEFAKKHGYGLMPPGQSTDSDFLSTHVQWFYTDTWTLHGITEIAKVLVECGIPEGEHFVAEAEDYRLCFMKALDAAIWDVDDMPERPEDYDFSAYLFTGPLERDRITEWDENGIPLCFKDHIIVQSEAKKRGIRYFLHGSTSCCVPMDKPYMCNMTEGNASLGLLYALLDMSSDEPLYPGAKHTGKMVWDALQDTRRLIGLPPFDNNGLSYNEYFLLTLAAQNKPEEYEAIWNFTRHYGCDPETYMMVEQVSINRREQWFQPCPFALSMANYRRMMERMVIYDDQAHNCLSICRLLPQEWVERTVTHELPLYLKGAATAYGTVSVRYRADLIGNRVLVELELADPARLNVPVEVYFRHPLNEKALSVTANGELCASDGLSVTLTAAQCKSGRVTVVAKFEDPVL